LIDQVVRDAHEMGKPVTVCGEMAGDPAGTIALSALGVDSLSVAVPQYLRTRRTLAATSAGEMQELRRKLLHCRSGQEVRRLLSPWME
jgi:phosphotransferase system enzyme I (PtsP)